jgi:hypothetical protein
LPAEQRTKGLPPSITYYLAVNAFAWMVCLTLFFFWARVQHLPYPYYSIFMPETGLRDLWWCGGQFASLHSEQFFNAGPYEPWAYPPGTAIAFALFHNVLPRFHSIPFISVTFGGLCVLAMFFVQCLQRLGVTRFKAITLAVVALVPVYPFAFTWTTGNIEFILFLTLSCGIIAFLRGHYLAASICIGFCASMKLFPFVFLALFLSRRRYKDMVVAVVSFFVSSLAGLWLLCPDIRFSWKQLNAALKLNRSTYMQAYLYPQSAADHSMWGLIKTASFIHSRQTRFSGRSISLYMAASAIIGLALYFWKIRSLPLLNQIVCLYLAMVLLVPESFEYTLIHLSIALALLVLYAFQAAGNARSPKGLIAAFLCLAVVLAPENELIFHGHGYWGPAKCIVLILLFFVALTSRWEGLESASWLRPKSITA